MRASRLLSIMLLLHTRGRISAQQLADELEVSPRTVYRDVEALNAAGVPVYATRGRAGGFQLLDGYRTRLTGLSPDEADALFLAGLPGAAADLGLGSTLAATQLKLLAALPPELRERAARIRDRFHLDAPGWLRESEELPYLATVADAVWAQHRLRVRYERANRAMVDRVLEPLGLVLKAGTWYLVAAVRPDARADIRADARGPRTYRVARIHSAAVLDEPFERPTGFDLEAHWSGYQRDYERRVFTGTATIRLSPAGRQLLFLIGSAAARAGHVAMSEPDGDGWATTTVPIESVRHARHALLQLGADAEVLAPEELRDAVAASARATAQRYAKTRRYETAQRYGAAGGSPSPGSRRA